MTDVQIMFGLSVMRVGKTAGCLIRRHSLACVSCSGVATGGLDGVFYRGPQAQAPSEPHQQTII